MACERSHVGDPLWPRVSFANMVAIDEEMITRYVEYQEQEQKKEEQQQGTSEFL